MNSEFFEPLKIQQKPCIVAKGKTEPPGPNANCQLRGAGGVTSNPIAGALSGPSVATRLHMSPSKCTVSSVVPSLAPTGQCAPDLPDSRKKGHRTDKQRHIPGALMAYDIPVNVRVPRGKCAMTSTVSQAAAHAMWLTDGRWVGNCRR